MTLAASGSCCNFCVRAGIGHDVRNPLVGSFSYMKRFGSSRLFSETKIDNMGARTVGGEGVFSRCDNLRTIASCIPLGSIAPIFRDLV